MKPLRLCAVFSMFFALACGSIGKATLAGVVQVDCPEVRDLHQGLGLAPFNNLVAYTGDRISVTDANGTVIGSVELGEMVWARDGRPVSEMPSLQEAGEQDVAVTNCYLPFATEGIDAEFVSLELRGENWTGIPVNEVDGKPLRLTVFSSPSWNFLDG